MWGPWVLPSPQPRPAAGRLLHPAPACVQPTEPPSSFPHTRLSADTGPGRERQTPQFRAQPPKAAPRLRCQSRWPLVLLTHWLSVGASRDPLLRLDSFARAAHGTRETSSGARSLAYITGQAQASGEVQARSGRARHMASVRAWGWGLARAASGSRSGSGLPFVL